jgi:hypothetical protein
MDPTAAPADNLPKPPVEGEAPAETASAPALAGGKARKTSKAKGRKSRKSRKMNKSAKNWVSFVTDIFNKNRATNPKYKYKQAMKDASIAMKKNKKTKL